MRTHSIPLIIPNLQLSDIFSYGATNEVETALVNEASVFEPLRVYCVLVLNVVC